MKMSVWSIARQQSIFQQYHSENIYQSFTHKMAAKLRDCHPMYTADSANKSGAETANNTVQLPVANPSS